MESSLCLRITPKEHFKADLSERTNEIRGERGRKRDGGRQSDGGVVEGEGGEGKGGVVVTGDDKGGDKGKERKEGSKGKWK